uniref:protein kinase domain-containing protein n=1 Tax=Candidatus Cryptobacteroides bacterium TaxID=3085639 RepID=UPI00402728FB
MTENEILNNRYQLMNPIGRGSFGEVWMANDLRLDITVAVKVYAALDGKGITEFRDEFKNVYKLHHPNLLRPDYFDTVGDNPYLVMPYCPKSADDLVGQMTEHELWRFIRDVASGLAYLHDNDVIHRDIKPENILQDERGDYVISDFGLSIKMRSTLRQASMRQNDGFSGTIAYMAPELFTSKPTAVKATDVWALGVTIYEMATGELPFCGQGGCMLNAGAKIPEFDTATWSSSLNEVMRLCLAKDPWDRPIAENLAEYGKLVMNGDKRTWSQWKDNIGTGNPSPSNPRPVLEIALKSVIAFVSLIALYILCYCFIANYAPKEEIEKADPRLSPVPVERAVEEPIVNDLTESDKQNDRENGDWDKKKNDTHRDDLLSAPAKDLSTAGNANCYIVSQSGKYKFKTIKGNSIFSVGEVKSASVLWESFGTSKTPSIGDLIKRVSYEDGYIFFQTPSTFKKGNAVIAAKDAEGEILWSWHIWLTDMPEEQVYFNNAGTMMDRNLGATSAIPGDVGAIGLLYQWGRKDPFLGSSSIKKAITAKSTLSWPTVVDCTSITGTIDYSVLHPTTFIKGDNINSDWYYMKNISEQERISSNMRWGLYANKKSEYDPCPAGWQVPNGGASGVWAQASGSPNRKNYTYDSINEGMNFSGEFGAASNIWYPASYCRMYNNGDFYEGEKFGNWWSSSTRDDNLSYKLTLSYAGWYNSSDFSYRANARSVRCIKKKA